MSRQTPLFAEIFQRDLDPFVIHFLVLAAELLAAVGGAMEELDDVGDRCPFGRLDACGAAYVDHAVEIEVIDIVIELPHRHTPGGLVTDAQHFGARARRWNVLKAPSASLEPETRNRRAIQLKPDSLGLR